MAKRGPSGRSTSVIPNPVRSRPTAFAPSVALTWNLQIAVNETLGMAAARDDLNNDGVVDVVEIQILINTLLGGTCMAL